MNLANLAPGLLLVMTTTGTRAASTKRVEKAQQNCYLYFVTGRHTLERGAKGRPFLF